jgi:hypothetical protein
VAKAKVCCQTLKISAKADLRQFHKITYEIFKKSRNKYLSLELLRFGQSGFVVLGLLGCVR